MTIRFGAINVLDSKSPDYVTVGDRVRHNATGRELVLERCEMLSDRLGEWVIEELGGDRVQLYGRVVVQGRSSKLDADTFAKLSDDQRAAVSGPVGNAMYTFPLDNEDGTLNRFDRVG